MGKTLAIIHTTPLTIEPLKRLAQDYLPSFEVINFVDDSILPQLRRNGGKVEEVEERLIQYTKYAEQAGASIILNACSSVGEVVDKARKQLSVPIIRIDEAMGEEAMNHGKKIGVIATLSTTLNPTVKLLEQIAIEYKKTVDIHSVLAEEAYQYLIQGDPDEHDLILAEQLSELAKKVDIVVLAQASMARAVAKLPEEQQKKFLTSPELGMERVKQTIEGLT
ncbi:aspartate/glutamate racemase family protein [Fictibacillus phosphorivorans]|uniref:aspartate/glutamate racemase family protein n=1 Tax=Fictibacillus phosphorivorans TaxID=1221500 RepID=UPI0020409343|nr:aspartate/glutamate racemase family protein [Fictibacillus phosphorivorans]MCM3717776.1 aspartate/glutamate racemase family protein [Fictibacillus phosphorivorans]MCM3777004.1 aspartate/glutamate racemase family protein [Fictibacillus phosphorivorans]